MKVKKVPKVEEQNYKKFTTDLEMAVVDDVEPNQGRVQSDVNFSQHVSHQVAFLRQHLIQL